MEGAPGLGWPTAPSYFVSLAPVWTPAWQENGRGQGCGGKRHSSLRFRAPLRLHRKCVSIYRFLLLSHFCSTNTRFCWGKRLLHRVQADGISSLVDKIKWNNWARWLDGCEDYLNIFLYFISSKWFTAKFCCVKFKIIAIKRAIGLKKCNNKPLTIYSPMKWFQSPRSQGISLPVNSPPCFG